MPAVGITVLKHNVPWGPFTRMQIREGLVRGDFTLQSLAHVQGVKEWLPLSEVLDHVDRSAVLPPVPDERDLPPLPESAAAPPERKPPPPSPPPLLPPSWPETIARPPETPSPSPAPPVVPRPEAQLPPASFIPRGIAFLIDCAVLFVPILLVFALGALTIQVQDWLEHTDPESKRQGWDLLKRDFYQLFFLVAIGLGWLYAAGLECSRWQATVGKRWMGIKVTDANGERLGFLRATGRYAAKYLSALPCFLGFMAALFSSRGLALHDRLAKTRVVKQ